jgi:hypothetical protein
MLLMKVAVSPSPTTLQSIQADAAPHLPQLLHLQLELLLLLSQPSHRSSCHACAVHRQPQEPVQRAQRHPVLNGYGGPQVGAKPYHVLKLNTDEAAAAKRLSVRV